MDELINRMNKLLASSYSYYLKASFFHWNVKGEYFPMYHSFLGDLYSEVYDSIDTIAEHIRQLDGVPQNSPSMLKQNTYLTEATSVINSKDMMSELLTDTQRLVKDLVEINTMSERFSEIGLSNFLQDRHAAFKKHAWMLKSIVDESTE